MENRDEKTVNAIAAHYREILRLIGENPEREGLKKDSYAGSKGAI